MYVSGAENTFFKNLNEVEGVMGLEICLVVTRILSLIGFIFACNYTSLFLIPMAKKRENSCCFNTLSNNCLLPREKAESFLQKAVFLMTRLKIMLAVYITES